MEENNKTWMVVFLVVAVLVIVSLWFFAKTLKPKPIPLPTSTVQIIPPKPTALPIPAGGIIVKPKAVPKFPLSGYPPRMI